MLPQWIIEKKRDGKTLEAAEITSFINDYTAGRIPDYQMAALAMAIYFQGMSFDETAALTEAMMRSGDLFDTSSIKLPKVDKHSTGGIGDKVSLILAPLVACCGVAIPMVSGRGLGITGGTVDKFQSIPGYRVDISEQEFVSIVNRCGCSNIGQTARLAPADKKLYALRDVTATVPSIPLITASIMSKKMAEGIDALVLDVKLGSGAFMRKIEDARKLASNMVEVGRRMGKRVSAMITDMNEPLGRSAGNALEVIETLEVLSGGGSPDLVEITLELCAEMLLLAGVSKDRETALEMLRGKISSGAALAKFKEMISLHGAKPADLDHLLEIHPCKYVETLNAGQDGWVSQADAELIGRACLLLGAGRTKVDDTIDYGVGVSHLVKRGEKVKAGTPLLIIHANDKERLGQAKTMLTSAIVLSNQEVKRPPIILERI